MLAFTSAASAQNPANDWKNRMMAEKIAFLTIELGITPEEAQAFWPVYNEISQERDKTLYEVFRTFKEMEDGLNAGCSKKEAEKLLENYLEALENQREVESNAAKKYSRVLSVEKMAKLYVGEEKFRRQHIRKMRWTP